MTNIFVARLDYGVTQEDLQTAFADYGQVNKVSLAMDRETGKSKGFAFIEMNNDDEAQAAIEGLNGSTMSGREIAVKEADKKDDSRPKRDFSAEKKPFSKPSGDTPFRKPSDESAPSAPFPDSDSGKGEGRKKSVTPMNKKDKPKTHKMEAYKKSGKQPRYTDFDDDDDDYKY